MGVKNVDIFSHEIAIIKLLCTCDAISKLLASKLIKIASFLFFLEKTLILWVVELS